MKPYIGGQAVVEGVMMRSPRSFVVAVRRPDGRIAIREQAWAALLPDLKFLRWPLFRGALVLIESLHNGFSALKFSADHGLLQEEGRSTSEDSGRGVDAMMALATVAMVGLFIASPHLLTYGLSRMIGGLDSSGFAFHLIDGGFRLVLLLGYLFAIARTEQAARLFAYHGAEHKAIWTYESGLPLTVDHARTFSRQHPRCGTSFLFVVVLISVLVHVAVVPWIPRVVPNALGQQLFLIGVKIGLAFPIAGLAYELQKISSGDRCPRVIRWLTQPGLWLQNVTTREPSDDQLEIALLALARALAREEGKPRAADGVSIYPDFSVAAAA